MQMQMRGSSHVQRNCKKSEIRKCSGSIIPIWPTMIKLLPQLFPQHVLLFVFVLNCFLNGSILKFCSASSLEFSFTFPPVWRNTVYFLPLLLLEPVRSDLAPGWTCYLFCTKEGLQRIPSSFPCDFKVPEMKRQIAVLLPSSLCRNTRTVSDCFCLVNS